MVKKKATGESSFRSPSGSARQADTLELRTVVEDGGGGGWERRVDLSEDQGDEEAWWPGIQHTGLRHNMRVVPESAKNQAEPGSGARHRRRTKRKEHTM